MKVLGALVLLAAGIGVGFSIRHLTATTSPPAPVRPEGGSSARPALPPALRTEAAALTQIAPASGSAISTTPDDLVLARIAFECGNHLFDRAGKQGNDAQLMRQASQHYRACLSHETPPLANDTLFQTARRRVEEIDRRLQQRDPPAATSTPTTSSKPTTSSPPPSAAPASPPTQPAPVNQKAEPVPETTMVGPDGVPVRRLGRDR